MSKARKAYKREGIFYLIRVSIKLALNLPKNYFLFWYYKFKPSKTFEFQGKTYQYFYHHYDTTWKNERAIEIPIIWNIVESYQEQGKGILEVGNVLSHRFHINYDIVDKYEDVSGRQEEAHVINEDIVDFNPSKHYDLIISISTLEHVGWDETPRDPTKILRAVENLKRLLAAGGQMMITLPLGYNPEMDKLLRRSVLQFDKQFYLKRTSNKWHEVDWEQIRDINYNWSVPTATALLIGIIHKNNNN